VYLYNQELGISALKPLCKKGSSSECRAPLACVFAIPFQTTVQLQQGGGKPSPLPSSKNAKWYVYLVGAIGLEENTY